MGMDRLMNSKYLKKIFITNQVFPPERHPSALMFKQLAEELHTQGFKVAVGAGFPNHPYGKVYGGYKKKLVSKENINGYLVVRGWHITSTSDSYIIRAVMMLSQGLSFALAGLVIKNTDLVICAAPPIIGPIISAIMGKLFKAKIINIVFDLYPDILISSGYLKNRVLIKLAKLIEKISYILSDHIIVLSEGFKKTLINEKHIDSAIISVIPVWLDGRDIVPMKRNNSWRRQMGIEPEKFVVLYAGTIGLVSGAEVVVEAASRLQSHQDILFLLVGEGQAKDRVEAMAREFGLNNIRFLPFQPRERLSEVQATADVSLVTLAPGRGKTSVPSKVLGYMAAARPVIAAVDDDCDTAELIREAHCGLVVPPAQPETLSDAILNFSQDSEARKLAGENGLKYFECYFERKQVMAKYIALIEGLFAGSIEPGNR
ncbi:MAG TPA: hypothetical protein DEQ03_13195 [Marinilabiliales bacterium]|nr:hypothetical protein [Marinilabiliales bacterium]